MLQRFEEQVFYRNKINISLLSRFGQGFEYLVTLLYVTSFSATVFRG